MKKRKRLKKSVLLFLILVIVLSMTFSSFEKDTLAISTENIPYQDITNIIDKKEIDSKYVSILSKKDNKYISNLFNLKTGKEVSIESILKPEKIDLFWEKVRYLIYLKYPAFIADVISKNDKTNSYYIKDNELVIYFYDYEIEPLVNEELFVRVNYNEIKDYMDITIKLDKTYENEDGQVIDENKKVVALTFDDGPGIYTSNLVDILVKNKSQATFFMLGKNLNNYKDTVLKVYNSGMEIGYHSYNHKNFKRQKITTIKDEFKKSNEVLKSITGDTFHLIRPPYGVINESIKNSLDAPFILWDIDTLDWKHKDSTYLVNYVLDNLKNGNIVLFHDIHKTSVEAIDKLLPLLYVNGYQTVTISSLAKLTNTNLENHKSYKLFKK